jgi:hypothetical protein
MRPWPLLLFVGASLHAQDHPRNDFDPASLVDEIFATQDLDLNYQDLYENFLQLISRPLDLNSVTDEQLRSLYLLKSDEVNSILAIVRKQVLSFRSTNFKPSWTDPFF